MSKTLLEMQLGLEEDAVHRENIRLKELLQKETMLAKIENELLKMLLKSEEETNDLFVQKYYEIINKIFKQVRDEITGIQRADNEESEKTIDWVQTELKTVDDNEDLNEKLFFYQAKSMHKVLMETQALIATYRNDQLEDELKIIEEDFGKLDEMFNQIDKTNKNFLRIFQEMQSVKDLKRAVNRNIKTRQNQIAEEIETTKSILSEIKTPVFDGTLSEWHEFRDLFLSVVDSKNIPNVDKMYYLKESVQGDAAILIQNLKITNDNYPVAWEILKQRYDNRRLQFETIIDKILYHSKLENFTVGNIKQLLDSMNSCLHGLKSMGIELNNEQPVIARVLIRKLGTAALNAYEHNVKKTKEIQTLEDVMGFLEQQYNIFKALQ